jgi:AraC-like DNA-binding protein
VTVTTRITTRAATRTTGVATASAKVSHVARAITPVAFIRTIVLGYERYGVDIAGLLAAAQITPAQLEEPDGRISAAQLEAASGHAMRELDDEALGWFARRLPWGSTGMLCRASLGAPDLGRALARWCRHHRLLEDDLVFELQLPAPASDDAATPASQTARLRLVETRDFGATREFCLLTYLRFIHGWACWSIDSQLPLQRVCLPFARPTHGDLYELLFPGPIEFGAARAGFDFDASYLTLPQRRDEAALRRLLARLLPLIVKPYRRDRLLVQRVRQLLADGDVVGSPANGSARQSTKGLVADLAGSSSADAVAIAQALNVSPRTLFRRLADEGASLQQLKEQARLDKARHWLSRSSKPIKQIAGLAGYASEKSFARAFKGWTGVSPSEYRQRTPG